MGNSSSPGKKYDQKPKLIILIRHGESQSNANQSIITEHPAHLIGLTDRGWKQSYCTGLKLLKLFKLPGIRDLCNEYESNGSKGTAEQDDDDDDYSNQKFNRDNPLPLINEEDIQLPAKLNITFYLSPFKCTRESLKCVLDVINKYNEIGNPNCREMGCPETSNPCRRRKHAYWPYHLANSNELDDDKIINYVVREDPRLREQDFGNFKDIQNMNDVMNIRKNYGQFFFRFPQGENAADVYNRVANFQESLYRSFSPGCHENLNDITVIVTHEIFIKVFLMKWFRWTYEEFDALGDIPNGSAIVMELDEQVDRYCLRTVLHKE